MLYTRILDPVEFKESTTELLAAEAAHNLMRGVLGNLINEVGLYEDYRLCLVEQDGQAVSAALMTKPYHLILADASHRSAVTGLVEGLIDDGQSIPGALGNRPTVDWFVADWTNRTKSTAELVISQGIFELESVAALDPPEGIARPATLDEAALLFRWLNEFLDEALPQEPRDDQRMRKAIHHRVAAGGHWVWEVDGEVVAMTSHGSPTGTGIRIGGVYTPAELRGNGYATGLVAAQSTWLLNNGFQRCFLFTDLTNPTSNAIYERIGYRKVGEGASYTFVSRGT